MEYLVLQYRPDGTPSWSGHVHGYGYAATTTTAAAAAAGGARGTDGDAVEQQGRTGLVR